MRGIARVKWTLGRMGMVVSASLILALAACSQGPRPSPISGVPPIDELTSFGYRPGDFGYARILERLSQRIEEYRYQNGLSVTEFLMQVSEADYGTCRFLPEQQYCLVLKFDTFPKPDGGTDWHYSTIFQLTKISETELLVWSDSFPLRMVD